MKRLFRCRFVLVITALLLHPFAPLEAREVKQIGVLLFSDEARYHEALKGVREQLEKAGFREPGVKYVIGNAGGSKARTAELVQQFATGKYDLMITLGTNATIAVARDIRDVPIVFSMVYDPVDVRVAKDWKHSGTNATGTSPRVPMGDLVALLQELKPVKKLAVLYSAGEKNSEIQLKEIQAVQERYRIRVVPVNVVHREEIFQNIPEVLRTVDAVYFSGSSVIGGSILELVEMANKARVVTITHLEDLVEKGVLVGICSDPYQLGSLAGKKAVKVLKGTKPTDIPIEPLRRFDIVLNKKSVAAGNFSIPPSFEKKVTRTFQ